MKPVRIWYSVFQAVIIVNIVFIFIVLRGNDEIFYLVALVISSVMTITVFICFFLDKRKRYAPSFKDGLQNE